MTENNKHNKKSDIAVLYLLRAGNPERLYANFLNSIQRYPAGIPYRPVVIQKGYPPGFIHPLTSTWPTQDRYEPDVIEVSDEGYALNAFRDAATRIEAKMLLFFTSHSRVLAPNWLTKLYFASTNLGQGSLVGATGSWESLGEITSFPNIVIRTNAFLINRQLFLSFTHPLNTRYDGNLFEAGPKNITKSIIKSGGKVAIIDRNGKIIEPIDWPNAKVFRSGNQEQLLVEDNRTIDYQHASFRKRKRLAQLAFGDHADPGYQNLITRWRSAIAYSLGL